MNIQKILYDFLDKCRRNTGKMQIMRISIKKDREIFLLSVLLYYVFAFSIVITTISFVTNNRKGRLAPPQPAVVMTVPFSTLCFP